ncbi:MAG: glycosyltransferase family 2 protein, partial [Leptospiraceae bacterium]|nr:glycosyltransferase family 2 protein [Leptospiraceae bacterium]
MLFALFMALFVMTATFLGLIVKFPPYALSDITPLTYLITIVMTVIGSIWASYAVLGLLVKPKKHGEKTFAGKFSILIPARNEEKVISNLVNDLLKQTYKNFEIIVVCHNCTDNTYDIVKNFKDNRIKPLLLNEGSGKSVALNYGAKKASGDILVIFDADNRVPSDFLERISHYFPTYDAVQSRIETGNPNFNILTRLAELEFISFTDMFQTVRSAFDLNNALGGTGEAIKRDVIEKVGYWDEWALTEDFALFTKLTARGYKIGWANDTYVLDEKVPWWHDFFRQRARWIKGHLQVAFKYAHMYLDNVVDFHYLIAPISIFGYYFTIFLWLIFLLQLPVATRFIHSLLWIIPWVIWNLAIVVRITKRKGLKVLLLFPLFFVYLYHWIAVFAYIPKVKTWTKTCLLYTS